MRHAHAERSHSTLADGHAGELQSEVVFDRLVESPVGFDVKQSVFGQRPALGRYVVADHRESAKFDRSDERFIGHAINDPFGTRLAQRLEQMLFDSRQLEWNFIDGSARRRI